MIRIGSQQRDGVSFTVALNERDQLIACAFSDKNIREAEKAVMNAFPSSKIEKGGAVAPRFFKEVYAAYSGKGERKFNALDLSNVSEFRKRVYDLLDAIPRGKVSTYGALAKKLGSMRYARAVGTAVATNPIPLIIPCHRVVPASLKVGNYGTPGRNPSEGGYVKRGLLEREGVIFQGEKVSTESVWNPR